MKVAPVAEREGFEPSMRETRIPDFESGAFDHSATSPGRAQYSIEEILQNYFAPQFVVCSA